MSRHEGSIAERQPRQLLRLQANGVLHSFTRQHRSNWPHQHRGILEWIKDVLRHLLTLAGETALMLLSMNQLLSLSHVMGVSLQHLVSMPTPDFRATLVVW